MPRYDADRDLIILTAMANQLEPYLREEQLLWPISGRVRGGMPRLTLGGFLLRQHRLTALIGSLDDRQQATLAHATAQWQAVKAAWSVHYANKISREWAMRHNVLGEFLRDTADATIDVPLDDWSVQAEQRVQLHLLYRELTERGEAKDQKLDLVRLDAQIRRYLLSGDAGRFLWAAELAPVYPEKTFWWLWVAPVEADELGT